jgi:hypothetical protein
MNDNIFIDSNVLVYLYSDSDSEKPTVSPVNQSREERIAELDRRFRCVRVKIKDWKFNREEANER